MADHYLIWDSDTIMLRLLSFFDQEGKPLVNPTDRYHRPYFDLIERVLGFKRLVQFSFISEHLMVRKKYMQRLIEEIQSKGSENQWPFQVLDLVTSAELSQAGFSEFETYGNFVFRNYPGTYGIRKLRSLRSGAKRAGPVPRPRDLLSFSRKYDYVSFEVWTRQVRWKRFTWKLGTILYNGLASLMDIFSRGTAGRLKTFCGLFR